MRQSSQIFISSPKNLRCSMKGEIQTNMSQNLRSTKISDQILFYRRKQSEQKNKHNYKKIYNDLHSYIDSVENKVQSLLQTQSNQYKVVYQHYFKVFKDELFQLKEKTLQQQKQFTQNSHVRYLQSQLKLFKQEAFKYKQSYQKIVKENLKLKDEILKLNQEIMFYKSNAKTYLKQIKLFNSKTQSTQKRNIQSNVLITASNLNISQENSSQQNFSLLRSKKRASSISFQIFSESQKNNQYLYSQIKKENSNVSISDDKIEENREQLKINENKQKQVSSFRTKISKSKNQNQTHKRRFSKIVPSFRTQMSQKAQKQYDASNICKWFIQCVQTVNKQVLHRKSRTYSNESNRLSNQFRCLDSIDNFMKQDKLKVLKMFLSDYSIITIIYSLLKNQKFYTNLYKIKKQNQKLSGISKSQNSQNPSLQQENNSSLKQTKINLILNNQSKSQFQKFSANKTTYFYKNSMAQDSQMNLRFSKKLTGDKKNEQKFTFPSASKEQEKKQQISLFIGSNKQKSRQKSAKFEQNRLFLQTSIDKINLRKLSTNQNGKRNSKLCYILSKKKRNHAAE